MKIWKNGYAKDEAKQDITHSVNDVIKILFGNDFEIEDIDTFEKCFDIVKNNEKFKYRLKSKEILQTCVKSLKEKEKRLDFPSELKEFL